MQNIMKGLAASLCLAMALTACNSNQSKPAEQAETQVESQAPATPAPIEPMQLDIPAVHADTLNVKPPKAPIYKVYAEGVQVYECVKTADCEFGWKFKKPIATLYNENRDSIGTHYLNTDAAGNGAAWESIDGSKVVVKKIAEADAPKYPKNNIKWFLLEAIGHTGNGIFSRVTHVQRVDTEGGVAPPCSTNSADLGKEQSVPYKAVYYFY